MQLKRQGSRLEIEMQEKEKFRLTSHELTWVGISKEKNIIAENLPSYPEARKEFDAVKYTR